MSPADRLVALQLELARTEREPASYATAYERRWLAQAIVETEAEVALGTSEPNASH